MPSFLPLPGLILLAGLTFGCSNPLSENPLDPSDFTGYNVIINEFMVQQNETLADPDFEEYGGWIELHNRENKEVDVSGWILAGQSIENGTGQGDAIPEGTVIPPDGYLLIWTDGRGMAGEAIHTRFTLSEKGGEIGLYGPEWAENPVLDTVSYAAREVAYDISLGRMNFDGHDHIGFLLPMNRPTPGDVNRLARLQQIESFPLDIEDPSGLDVDPSGNFLWTVGDNSGGHIYKIAKNGEIVDILEVDGDDMEGIAQHPGNLLLFVAEERLSDIVQYDTSGNEIQRTRVAVEQQSENDGLEGITINPSNGHIFMVNEQNPRALVEMDLSRAMDQQLIRYTPVDFRAGKDAEGLDFSGLCFESEAQVLWLVSDEARAVFVLDLMGNPLAAYDSDEENLEGIAVIADEQRIYLVSDDLQQLVVYEYPAPLLRLPAGQ